jgi:hypothetical protein
MAKMVPIHGFLLSGKVGDVVFYRRGKTACVRFWVPPRDPRTEGQLKQRERLRAAVVSWKRLSAAEKQLWQRRAELMGRVGYQLFLSESLDRGEQNSTTT